MSDWTRGTFCSTMWVLLSTGVPSLRMIATSFSPWPLITRSLHQPTRRGSRLIRRLFSSQSCDPQARDLAHWLCDSVADVIAPVSFVMLSYLDDEWALNATRKNRARKESTLKELKIYSNLFIEAKSAEITGLTTMSSI